MNIGSHRIAKKSIVCLFFAAAVLLMAAFSSIASASPGFSEFCSDCHTGVGTPPVVTTNTAGGTTTYNVTQTSTAWAAFDMTVGVNDRIAGDSSTGGTFTAPAADFVRVCSADGSATGTWTNGYILTPTASANGTISPSTAQVVAKGANTTFTITPASGYKIADVTINGTSNPTAVSAGSYTFTNVQADAAIKATFASNVSNFTITATAGTGGKISPAGAASVASGASQKFTVTPDAGYKVAGVLVDGVAAQLDDGSYTFSNVAANHTIAVTFAAATQKSSVTLAVTGLKSGACKFGKSITCKGTVKPARAGKATMTFQRKVGVKWVKVTAKTATINATSGAYKSTYKPSKKGSWRVQVSVAKTTAYAAAATSWKTFKVK
jgi:hypothetical protein